MGKRMKDVYPYATRWQVFKYKVRMFFRKLLIASFLIGMIVGSYKLGKQTVEGELALAKESTETIFIEKVDKLKNDVVDEIQKCESMGYKEDDAIIIFDDNSKGTLKGKDKASLGTLQFKKSTVQHYYKTLYGETITAKEAMLIALDDEKAEALAKDIIFKTKNGYSNWLNCSNKLGIKSKVELVKQLEN